MAVKIRMARIGRRHRPFYRINAIDSRQPRDGKIIEKLGHYDPLEKDPAKQVVLDLERTRYWLEKGAVPSDTVSNILLRQGIKHKYARQKSQRLAKARAAAHAAGRHFTATEVLAAEKAKAAAEKKQADAKAAAEKKAADEKAAQAKAAAEKKAADEKAAAEKKQADSEGAAEEEAGAEEKDAKQADED